MNATQEIKPKDDAQFMDRSYDPSQTVHMEPKLETFSCFWAAMKHVCDNLPRGWQAKMAADVGVDPGYISQIYHKKSKNPSLEVQEKIALHLGFPSYTAMLAAGASYLENGAESPQTSKAFMAAQLAYIQDTGFREEDVPEQEHPHGASPGDDFLRIPYRNGIAAGGPGGGLELGKEADSYLSFRSDWLRHKGLTSQMAVIKVRGDSMSLQIPDGSVVMIDESRRAFARGKVFVITHKNELKVKRLDYADGKYILKSDDGITPDEPVLEDDQFQIEGRVLWTAHEVS